MLLTACVMFCALATNEAAERSPIDAEFHPLQQRIVERVNRERQSHGLRPLTIDRRLMRSARRHANWMALSRNLQHTHDSVAENIAMGQHSSDQAVRDWMNSPGHRANILGSYDRVGAAAITAPDGTVYWCLQLL